MPREEGKYRRRTKKDVDVGGEGCLTLAVGWEKEGRRKVRKWTLCEVTSSLHEEWGRLKSSRRLGRGAAVEPE